MFNKTKAVKILLDFGKLLLYAVFIGSQYCLLHYLWHKSLSTFSQSFGNNGLGYIIISFVLCQPGIFTTVLASVKIVSKIHWTSKSKLVSYALDYIVCLAMSYIALILLFTIPLGVDFLLLNYMSVPPNVVGVLHLLIMIFLINRLFDLGTRRRKQPEKVEEHSPNLHLAK